MIKLLFDWLFRKPDVGEKYRNRINKAGNKKVTIYQTTEKKVEDIDNYVYEQESKYHLYLINKYSDIELRKEIVEEAIDNNYPEDDLKILQLYNDYSVKWDLNISDEILEQYCQLEIYNWDTKMQKGIIKRLVDKVYYVFHQGGDDR